MQAEADMALLLMRCAGRLTSVDGVVRDADLEATLNCGPSNIL